MQGSNYCDLHTHSLFSKHAYSTIHENILAAKEAGSPLIGITDHFSPMVVQSCSDHFELTDFQYLFNMVALPRKWEGIYLLRGAEIDILDLDGKLFSQDVYCDKNFLGEELEAPINLFDWCVRDMDYLIASVHATSFAKGASRLEQTKAYIKALENEQVFILGHIGRSGLDIEIDPILQTAKDLGKCIELNEASFGYNKDALTSKCKHIASRAAEIGCYISFGSDAHTSYHIARFEKISSIVEELDLPDELLISKDPKRVVEKINKALHKQIDIEC